MKMMTETERKEMGFEYDVDLKHLVEIDHAKLEIWNQAVTFKKFFNESKNMHPLDVFYKQNQPPKTPILL